MNRLVNMLEGLGIAGILAHHPMMAETNGFFQSSLRVAMLRRSAMSSNAQRSARISANLRSLIAAARNPRWSILSTRVSDVGRLSASRTGEVPVSSRLRRPSIFSVSPGVRSSVTIIRLSARYVCRVADASAEAPSLTIGKIDTRIGT